MSTVEEVPLGSLEENDYNPRKRFDDAAMEDLKNSIENVGLVQPPTARPLENGDYEVISGVRRMRALKNLYDDDHEIPVHVRDVDDEQARWMALAENLDRMDLTPIEEARAYAQHVTIEVDGEGMQYDEYINTRSDENLVVEVPGYKQKSVQRLGQRINPDPPTIERRLELLVLPDNDDPSVQNMVVNGDLSQEAAHVIARLRQIPDADYRQEQMERLAERHSGSSPNLSELRDSVDGLIESYEEEQNREQARIERLESLVDEREGELRVQLEKASEAFEQATGDHLEVDNGDGIEGLAQGAVDQLKDRINKLGTARIDELDDRQAEVQKDLDRFERNIQVVRDEALDQCPFCGSGVHTSTLEEKIEEKQAAIDSITEEKGQINDQRETLRDIRSDLRQALTHYTDAVEELESVQTEVSA